MNISVTRLFVAFCLSVFFCLGALAQSEPADAGIRLHTLMGRYAPDLVLSPEERLQLKWERREAVAYRESVIDTLPVSNRVKRKLLRELHNSPFTETYEEVLGDLQAREESEEIQPQ